MASVGVRYIVDDVDVAIGFYCGQLGFTEVMHPAPTFAMLTQGELRLVLSVPNNAPGGGQIGADGTAPTPGGWDRIQLEVEDIAARYAALAAAGVRFRNEIVDGVGGRQVIVEDPAGNPIELFQPTRADAR